MEHEGHGVDIGCKDDSFEVIFGIGFRVGVVIAFIGLIMAFVPQIELTLALIMKYANAAVAIRTLPYGYKILILGIGCMGAAIIMNSAKALIEDFVNLVFYKD